MADNGSSSLAASRIKKICEDFNVALTRFEENLGFDTNVRRAISLIETSHVWILGDDDLLASDSLEQVCRVLEQRDVDFILAPPLFFSDGSAPKSTKTHGQAFMPSKDAADLFKSALWESSALSSHVWKVATWRSQHLDDFKGSDWVHFAALSLLTRDREWSTGSMESGLVHVRVGVGRWESHFGSAYISGLKQLDVVLRAAERPVYEHFRKARMKTNLHDAFFLTGDLTPQTRKAALNLVLKTLGRRWRVLLLDIPALYAPSSLKYLVLRAGKFGRKLAARLRK